MPDSVRVWGFKYAIEKNPNFLNVAGLFLKPYGKQSIKERMDLFFGIYMFADSEIGKALEEDIAELLGNEYYEILRQDYGKLKMCLRLEESIKQLYEYELPAREIIRRYWQAQFDYFSFQNIKY
jgi:hypothetical protein